MADVCVVGLGYVGLPLACEFAAAGHDVTGYDVDEAKVQRLRRFGDGSAADESTADLDVDSDLDAEALSDVSFTADADAVADDEYVLLAVPTPLDESKNPGLRFVEAAGEQVGRHLSPGATVVLESTVYPGATREVLVPALEAASGLDAGTDFSVGYSPERVVPLSSGPDLTEITKLVAGFDEETVEELADLYGTILDADVHRAPSIEVAEAAKCIENVQRDANVALMNEFALVCDALGVDSRDAIEAAATKWNFHEYVPGLVGGHCLPVDPYYLTHAAQRAGYAPDLIRAARETNEAVPAFLADKTATALAERPQAVNPSPESRSSTRADSPSSTQADPPGVLVAGLTYKPNASDVRSSAVERLVAELVEWDLDVTGFDPHAPNDELERAFGIPVQDDLSVAGYDALVVPVFHDAFAALDLDEVRAAMNDSPVLVDAMAGFRDRDPGGKGFVYETL